MQAGESLTASDAMDLSQIGFYRSMIETGNDLEQYTATNWFRKVLSIDPDPPIDAILKSGVVPVMVGILARVNSNNERLNTMLQYETAWALSNLCSGESEYVQYLVDQGAVPCFVRLLYSGNEDIFEQASLALGNIAADSIQHRDAVIEAGAIDAMAEVANTFDSKTRISSVRVTAWAMSNFCKGNPAPSLDSVSVLVPLLAMNVNGRDIEAVANSCAALSYIADGAGAADGADDSEVR